MKRLVRHPLARMLSMLLLLGMGLMASGPIARAYNADVTTIYFWTMPNSLNPKWVCHDFNIDGSKLRICVQMASTYAGPGVDR